MPNLQHVVENPAALTASVERMMSGAFQRDEVCINHGIRTPEELEELVLQPCEHSEDIAAYHRELDARRPFREAD